MTSPALLDRLMAAQEALIASLDASDVLAIETAIDEFSDSLDGIRASGAWHATPETIAQLTRALSLCEAARIRVNYLTDLNRRRLCLLHQAAGADQRTAYDRNGRIGG